MKINYFLPPDQIEASAKPQLDNVAQLPFVTGMAVMPDVHMGKGCCVGAVVATKGAIVPSIVGVDVGCGMIATKTKFTAGQLPDSLESLRKGIERRIPTGMQNNGDKRTTSQTEHISDLVVRAEQTNSVHDYAHVDHNWQGALGSLGGGNHFIEICLDETDQVWVVLHSGSRGIGNKLAQRHIKVAQKLMDEWFIPLIDKDLAYLPEHTQEFKNYIRDLLWAQEFAKHNRDEMMDRVLTELSYTFYNEDGHQKEIEISRVNCHHNFAQQENHFKQNMWVTRKGAIQMCEGQLGVIPGSMGTRSYIVSGLGNPGSFCSAPHGAGRSFSRTEARRRFTMVDYERDMQGIECRHSESLIDELPGAYKNIDTVIEQSKSLVKVEHVLKQVLNIKGD